MNYPTTKQKLYAGLGALAIAPAVLLAGLCLLLIRGVESLQSFEHSKFDEWDEE